MRKAIVWGVVVVIAAVLLPLEVTNAQRIKEQQLNVETAPLAERALSPLIQEEISRAIFGNMPLNVTLGGAISLVPPENSRFVGLTSATFTATEATVLVLSRGCFAEFPDTHPCSLHDLLRSQPPPPEWEGSVFAPRDFGPFSEPSCFDGGGRIVECGAEAHPAACCSGPAIEPF